MSLLLTPLPWLGLCFNKFKPRHMKLAQLLYLSHFAKNSFLDRIQCQYPLLAGGKQSSPWFLEHGTANCNCIGCSYWKRKLESELCQNIMLLFWTEGCVYMYHNCRNYILVCNTQEITAHVLILMDRVSLIVHINVTDHLLIRHSAFILSSLVGPCPWPAVFLSWRTLCIHVRKRHAICCAMVYVNNMLINRYM
jgi:hypothetical protein